MWYDSFFIKLNDFYMQFINGDFQWANIFNGVTMAIFFAILFTLFTFVVMMINSFCCGEVKLRRAMCRIKRFVSCYGVIDESNISQFKNLCLKKMPKHLQKICTRFLVEPTAFNQAIFKKSLQKSSDNSCVLTFVLTVGLFALQLVVSVVMTIIESYYLDGNALWMSISLFYSSLLLIAQAVQIYLIDNKNTNVWVHIYTDVASRLVKNRKNTQKTAENHNMQVIDVAKNEKKQASDEILDSIDELRRVVYGLIESGASKDLLKMFKDSIDSVMKTNFTSHVDLLRVNNIVEKINNYIA